jgi:peptidoglycan hydrolase-like protein with peptidoglycan-binding domain
MSKIRMAKIAGLAVGATVAFGSFVPMAGAVTVAELQAQINALMAQLASLQGGSTGVTAAISSDLTVGSSGTSVVVLQNALIAQGYLVMPAGVTTGYFGSLTKAAVMKWQAANGLPSTGYFGPLSRAKFNGSAGATGTVPGATVGSGNAVVGVITTPGVEGTLTVSENPSPASGVKLYEASSKVGVLGIKLEAKTSDIKIERIKLDLDCTTSCVGDSDFFRKIAQKVYIMDGSTVVGSADLNTNTVVEDGSDYFITVSGMSYVVPKDSTRVLTVALDARATWDSAFDGDTFTVGVPVEGVRGVDGAGVNQYGPATAFSNDFTSQGELADSATLTVSTNVNTVQDMEVVAAQGSSENEYDGLEILKADFRAEKDAVTITDLSVDVVRTGSGGATTTTGYLYDGSTLIGTDSIDTNGHAGFTFSDIDYTIPVNTTKTLTVKVDVDSAATTATIFTADIDNGDVTAENSNGTALTATGSATGESITVRSVGIEVSLVSKSITKSSTSASNNTSTSTAEAQFVIRVKAVGGDILLGDGGSTTPFVTNAGRDGSDDDPSFVVYRGGTAVATGGASSTSITVPSGVVVSGTTFTLQEGNTVDIPVAYLFEGRTTAGALLTTGSYAVGLAQLNWVSSAGLQSSDFMAGNAAWRTSTVALP